MRQLISWYSDLFVLAGHLCRRLQPLQLRLVLKPQIVDLQELLLLLRRRYERILMPLPVDPMLVGIPATCHQRSGGLDVRAASLRIIRQVILVRVCRVIPIQWLPPLRALGLLRKVVHLRLFRVRNLR